MMESLESQINNEYRFIVGEVIAEKGKINVLERYKTRGELEKDYVNWARYSFSRKESEKINNPIFPFEIVGNMYVVIPEIDALKRVYRLNETPSN